MPVRHATGAAALSVLIVCPCPQASAATSGMDAGAHNLPKTGSAPALPSLAGCQNCTHLIYNYSCMDLGIWNQLSTGTNLQQLILRGVDTQHYLPPLHEKQCRMPDFGCKCKAPDFGRSNKGSKTGMLQDSQGPGITRARLTHLHHTCCKWRRASLPLHTTSVLMQRLGKIHSGGLDDKACLSFTSCSNGKHCMEANLLGRCDDAFQILAGIVRQGRGPNVSP